MGTVSVRPVMDDDLANLAAVALIAAHVNQESVVGVPAGKLASLLTEVQTCRGEVVSGLMRFCQILENGRQAGWTPDEAMACVRKLQTFSGELVEVIGMLQVECIAHVPEPEKVTH